MIYNRHNQTTGHQAPFTVHGTSFNQSCLFFVFQETTNAMTKQFYEHLKLSNPIEKLVHCARAISAADTCYSDILPTAISGKDCVRECSRVTCTSARTATTRRRTKEVLWGITDLCIKWFKNGWERWEFRVLMKILKSPMQTDNILCSRLPYM